jgi:hypothetical protein
VCSATVVTPTRCDNEDVQPSLPPTQPTTADTSKKDLKLPAFWAESPASWFLYAESRFRLRDVTSEIQKFDNLVAALPRESVRLVLDVLDNPSTTAPYTQLKTRLLASHEITDFQRIEKLHQMGDLGDKKPSELLASMLELCPRVHEANKFFLFLFLQRLPAKLRVLLGDNEEADPRDLAVKADRLWAMHAHRQVGSVAAIEPVEESNPVAAVQQGQRNRNNGRSRYQRGRGGLRGNGRQSSAGQQAASVPGAADAPVTPAALARSSSGLCHAHLTYGDNAYRCEAPCSWGNSLSGGG